MPRIRALYTCGAMLIVALLLATWPAPGNASEPRQKPNLLQNGDFTLGTTAPSNWTWQVDQGAATSSWTSTSYVSAGRAVQTQQTTSGQADWRQLVTGIDPGTRYRFRAHIYSSNTAAGSHSAELQWFDAAGVYLSRDIIAATVGGQWVEVTSEGIHPPPGATSVWVLLRSYLPGTYRFDDVVLARQDESLRTFDGTFPLGLYNLPGRELLTNGDFEQASISPPTAWSRWVDAGTAAQDWDTTHVSSGTHSVKTVMPASGQSDWRQFVPDIDPNLRYRLSGSIFASNVAPGSHSIAVQWFNAAGVFRGQTLLTASTASQWITVSASNLQPPSDATGAWVLLRAYEPGTYYFDNISLSIDRTEAEWYSDVHSAGFSFIFAPPSSLSAVDAAGLKAILFTDTRLQNGADPTPLRNHVNTYKTNPALGGWHTWDEPAWDNGGTHPIPEGELINGYQVLRPEDTQNHPVWLNHAPRGTGAEPTNFNLLRPYNGAADIFSFDIYPVPGGWGHSALADQTVSSVGAYTDTLHEVVSDGGAQRKPVWMVLQGFGWNDLFDRGRTGEHAIEVQWFGADNAYLGRDVLSSPSPNAWSYVFNTTLTPPAGALQAWILLRTYHPGTYSFDGVSFAEQGGANLLQNGDMESGTAGSPAGWVPALGSGTATQSWSASTGLSGSHALQTRMQTFGQADWRQVVTNIDPARRYTVSGWIQAQTRPTRTETRFMAYDALIHGARGLAWWGNDYVPATAGLWKDIREVATELRTLSPALVQPTSFRKVMVSGLGGASVDSAIETLLLGTGQDLYLLAANRTPTSQPSVQLAISGLSLGTVTRQFESGTLVLTNNAFTDTFTPYQVHVYRLQ